MTPLDFKHERDESTTSWRRAEPHVALIERTAWNYWLVTLPDGDHAHDVRLERDHGAYVGDCRVFDVEVVHDARADYAVETVMADGGRRRWP